MAADYASRHADALSGLILQGAYPADGVDLTATRFPSISLLAEHDLVADAATVRGGLARLSPSSRLEVIPGSVHAFFGRYGPQQGDGVPTVDRAAAEKSILEAIVGYLQALK